MTTNPQQSLEDIEKKIDQIKEQKKLVKGDKEAEKSLAEKLRFLSLEKGQLLKSKNGPSLGSSNKKFELKVPKGTRDFNDKEMVIRELMFTKIKQVFKRYFRL